MPRRALWILWAVVAFCAACSDGKSKLTISGLKPRMGPYTGGDPVIISGSGFQSGGQVGMRVYFGGNEAKKVVILSDTEIRVDPPAVGTAGIGKKVDVEITFDDSRAARIKDGYEYMDPIGPKTP
jgi:hypothetical protein